MQWEVAQLIGTACLISMGCLMPAKWLPPLPNDKLLHFLAFGYLALLAGRLTSTVGGLAFALSAVFIVGVVIEIIQIAIPGRRFCWRDILANGAGILTAALCLGILLSI